LLPNLEYIELLGERIYDGTRKIKSEFRREREFFSIINRYMKVITEKAIKQSEVFSSSLVTGIW
jgi:hypothetical protein